MKEPPKNNGDWILIRGVRVRVIHLAIGGTALLSIILVLIFVVFFSGRCIDVAGYSVGECQSSAPVFAPLPKGAVVAFNASECPDGWAAFSEAQGRFILGLATASLGSNDVIENKSLRALSGSKNAVLSVENMPAHSHETLLAIEARFAAFGVGEPRYNLLAGSDYIQHTQYHTMMTSSAGQSDPTPIKVEPPYVVLLFCQKLS